jgi:Family of unknown function (DUF5681)
VSTTQENQVGYCKPPKEHQFKKGICPNPKGRGKKKPSKLAEDVREVLSELTSYREGKNIKRAPRGAVMIKNLATRAMKGDIRAATMLLDLRQFCFERTDTGPIILLVEGGLPGDYMPVDEEPTSQPTLDSPVAARRRRERE